MVSRADILAGEAYVQLDLDDEQYSTAMKLAMEQLKEYNRRATVVVRATRLMSSAFNSAARTARALGRVMNGVVGSVSKLSRLIFDTLAPSLFFLGAASAAFGAAILRAVVPAGKAFANLEDVVSRFRITFGQAAPEAERWGRSFARAIGFADSTILDVLGRFQALLTTQGVPGRAAQVASSGIAQLVPNLASFFEQRPEEVITRLFSGLVGEMEAVRRLGIDLSAQSVNAELGQFGIDPKTATQAQKALARYNIIVRQTRVAQQDLRLTSDSLANTVTRLNQSWVRTLEVIGAALAPALTSLANILDTVLRKLQPLFETTQFQRFATAVVAIAGGLFGLGTAAVAIAPLVTAFGSLASFATALAGTLAGGLTAGLVGALAAARGLTVALGAGFDILRKLGTVGGIKGIFGRNAGSVFSSIKNAFRGTGPRTSTPGGFGLFGPSGSIPIPAAPSSPRNPFAGTALFNASRANARNRARTPFFGPTRNVSSNPRGAFAGLRQQTPFNLITSLNSRDQAAIRNRLTRDRLARGAGGFLGDLRAQSRLADDAFNSRRISSFGQFGPNLFQRTLSRLRPVASGVGKALNAVGRALAAVGTAVGGFVRSFAQATILFEGALAAIRPITRSISSSFGDLTQAGKTLLGTIGGVAQAAISAGQTLFGAFGAVVNLLVDGNVKGAADVAVASWDFLREVARSSLGQIGNAFGDLFSAIGTAISELIKNAQYLAFIITNPIEATNIGANIEASRVARQDTAAAEQIQRALFARGALGPGDSVSEARGRVFQDLDGQRFVNVQDAAGNVRRVDISDAEFNEAQRVAANLADEFADELARGVRNKAIDELFGDAAIGDLGESIGQAFARVSAEITNDPAVVAARQRLANAIQNAAGQQPGPGRNIPGANPQQVAIPQGVQVGQIANDIKKSVSDIKNVGQSIQRIAQTAGLSDASGRGRFLSRDRISEQIQRQQLDALKAIQGNTERIPQFQGAQL